MQVLSGRNSFGNDIIGKGGKIDQAYARGANYIIL